MSICMGIDWSQDRNDVAFMNAAGAIVEQLTSVARDWIDRDGIQVQ